MEAVGPVFEMVKCLWFPLVRRIGYVKNLKKNFQKLKKEAKELYNMRDDMNLVVNTTGPGKVPTSQFQAWIKDVEEIENQISSIEVDFNADKKCFRGWCPDISSRMKLGKRMVTLINDISDLKMRIKFENGVMVGAPPRIVEMVSGPGIKAGTSIGCTLEKIVGCIRDACIQKIGIWGMGGVGKTTLMKNLNNLSEIAQMFDIVIWVTVSKDWNLRKMQNEVAQRLSLDLSNDMSNDGVSRRLYQRLKSTKYLLLLDDVWDKVNLEEVGIPNPNIENKCKIILTTRSRKVCNKMETDVEIRVEVLSEDEAWELFREKVSSVIDSPKIQPLARSVVKECGGLPLAIIVVGGALRKEDNVHIWKNALKELSLAATSQIEDMEEVVFKRLKFSYDRLKGDRKCCFLYGALYPEDHKIVVTELIEYWRAAGFIDDVANLAEAFDRGQTILKDLVDASLLEKCQGKNQREEYVKMHDVIRDLALRITSTEGEGCKFLVRAGTGVENPPRDEEWEECNVVSLMSNKLAYLPEWAVCPILSTLLLQNNYELKAIPESFFEFMPSLQVLDLSGTGIKSLPQSICNLVNLRGIYLNDCRNLVELPSEVGALHGLEVLHLGKYTRIQDLPIEVGGLTRLKCLQVSFYYDQHADELPKMIPQGIVSGLSLLEDLRIDVDKDDWRWAMDAETVSEAGNLKKLTHLEFRFAKVEHAEFFINMSEPWKKGILSSFHFIVNNASDADIPTLSMQHEPPQVDRFLRFENGDDIPSVIKQVLRRAECFILVQHKSIKKLWLLGVENMVHLKYLVLQRCDEIESLIDTNCSLPNLEQLCMFSMGNLRNIWKDRGQALVNLRVLFLDSCHRLQAVLTPSMIRQIPNLEEIRVEYCDDIKEIIEGDVEYTVLPKLKILELSSLGNLESISKQVLAWPSIEQITIYCCENLKRLPFGIHNTSTLKMIQCHEAWWDALQWEGDEVRAQLQPLFTAMRR